METLHGYIHAGTKNTWQPKNQTTSCLRVNEKMFFSFKNLYTGEGTYIEHMEVLVLLLALFRTTSVFFVFILAGLWFWRTFQIKKSEIWKNLKSEGVQRHFKHCIAPVVEHNLKKKQSAVVTRLFSWKLENWGKCTVKKLDIFFWFNLWNSLLKCASEGYNM